MLLSFLRLLVVGAALATNDSSVSAFQSETNAVQSATINFPNGASIVGVVEAKPAGNDVKAFRGIPYAEPPIGPKRWKPSTLKPVTGTLQALNYGSTCLGVDSAPGSTEDCLFLNVFAPASATTNSKLPVMVWIHGGALLNGASNSFDGHGIVKASGQKVVVVTINYRVGAFGFFSSKELLAEGNGANFGFLDQEVAFQWVKKYIQYFGGDPNSVTAFGGSAGAWSIGAHLVSRDGNQKLFERAILESGAYSTVHDTPPPSVQQAKADLIKNGVGCGNVTDVMACLRKADANKLALIKGADWRGFAWMPTVDGKFLKDVPSRLFRSGKVSRIPTMCGHNTEEGWMFTSWVKDESQLDNFLKSQFSFLTDAEYAQIKTLYPASSFLSIRHHTAEIYGDAFFTCPTQVLSDTYSGATYRYRFNYPVLQNGYKVTNHGGEGVYVFNQVGSIAANDTNGQALARHFQTYWTNFARTNSPNVGNPVSLQWPVFNKQTKQEVLIEPKLSIETENTYRPGHAERCAFWLNVEERIAKQVKFA